MADEEIQDKASQGGGLGRLVMVGMVFVALAAGIVVYFLFLAPRLADDPETAEGARPPSTDIDPLPEVPNLVVTLESNYVNVMRDSSGPAPLLAYGIKLECNNSVTMNLVLANQHRFEDMIMKLHDSRTRDELDDLLLFKESVQRQAMQKANDLLSRLQGDEPSENVKITAVYHYQLMVQDPV